ncbi:MAG: dUTP diphosphatase [Gammaproteobacteria bacterium]|jgi:dUTP pyrophosphatase|nr:dUTP diphosphatase [Gammaproteobacteria bacterium]MBT7603651.1 dUTP diphosphatase [Gammaproteobacteria bacterium]|tara:strand:+ start:197 stop:655 length:459 start_codon:yes stop_codon:yes gene_type:complete
MAKKVQVKILNSKIGLDIPMPTYATDGSAAMDIRACIDNSIELLPRNTTLIPTGIAFYIEDNDYAGIILPRSGLGHKHGIILGNSVGLIDSDYQGELMVSLFNNSENKFLINPGDRIAQFLLIPVINIEYNFVDDFEITERSSGGFGHSGKN